MGTIGYDNKLSSFLFGSTRHALLALLFEHPDQAFYVNQIVQSLGKGTGAVQRELRLMTEAGLVTRTQRDQRVYYQADSRSPVFNELREIIRKTSHPAQRNVRVPQARLDAFCRKRHISRLAFFGSVLRDDFGPESDIDVLVDFEPGYVPGLAFFDMQDELSKLLGRRVDLHTPADLSPRFRESVVRESQALYG